MTRKFKFLGYGNRKPTGAFEKGYSDMNPDTEYWFSFIDLTVGKVYEAISVDEYIGESVFPDAKFVDDTGCLMTQELRFFEEVLDHDWELEDAHLSDEELSQMDASAEELRVQFEG